MTTKLRPLFEITGEMQSLIERLEIAFDDDAADLVNHEPLLDWLNEIDNQAKEKIDAYAWVVKRLESEIEQAKLIRDEFAAKARTRENRVELLKSMLKQHLIATGQTKVEGKNFKIALQKNGGSLPVEIFDETIIPQHLLVVTSTPNKTAIRESIESGIEVPGAMLGEHGESVRIR